MGWIAGGLTEVMNLTKTVALNFNDGGAAEHFMLNKFEFECDCVLWSFRLTILLEIPVYFLFYFFLLFAGHLPTISMMTDCCCYCWQLTG